MSDPTPTPERSDAIQEGLPPAPVPFVQTTEQLAYQPISGWAVAGFGTGAIFAFLVLLATGVALWQGAPMFFPVWLVGLAILGIVLSLLGQWHVQNSEGTRAGAKLARIGVWLSLISGLSYLSYYFVTGLALQSQAKAFLMEKADKDDDAGFFPRLKAQSDDPVHLNAAFLMSVPGTQRSAKPDNEEMLSKLYDTVSKDGKPGMLAQFRYGLAPTFNSAFPRLFYGKPGKDVEITPMGVQEWEYKQRSYRVKRTYNVKSKELDWEVTLVVASTEAEAAGQGRKWFVNLAESGSNVLPRLTPFGEGLFWLRKGAKESLEKWIHERNEGAPYGLIDKLDQTDWPKTFGPAAGEKRDVIHKLFASNAKNRIEQPSVYYQGQGMDIGRWEQTAEGRLRIAHQFHFSLAKEPGQAPLYHVDAYAVLETERDVDPMAYSRTPTPPQPEWNVVQIGFISISPPPEMKKGFPGG